MRLRNQKATGPKTAEKPVKSRCECQALTLDQVAKAWKQIRAVIKPQSLSLDGFAEFLQAVGNQKWRPGDRICQ